MDVVSFDDFVSQLPNGNSFEKATKSAAGIRYIESSNPAFVKPTLRAVHPIVPGETSVVILSAAGAVGKSTLAAALAHETNATLWDLSQVQVGTSTFAGAIATLWDFKATGAQKRIREGELPIILDSLDESQVRAGQPNFDAFLDDLITELRDPRAKPTVIMLARSDTADWMHLKLEDASVPLARYSIELFGKSEARLFLDQRLDARCSERNAKMVHREQRQPYETARDRVFEFIYSLFELPETEAWSDSRVSSFLGYAPVLEAFADYLDVSNYMELMGEIESGSTARSPWGFLAEVVDRLMDRERRKVVKLVRKKLEVVAGEWADWDLLYDANEQCHRTLSHVLRSPATDAPRASMPASLAVEYENAIATFLPQHPFLAGVGFSSVVFREYAYAWGISNAGTQVGVQLRERFSDRTSPFLPSAFLGRFATNIAGGDAIVIDGQDFGVLYESLRCWPGHSSIAVVDTESDMLATVDFEGPEEESVLATLVDTGLGITFRHHLSNADILVGCTVHLGQSQQRLRLGPDVEIRCASLTVECELIDVEAGKAGVLLVSGSFQGGVAIPTIRVYRQVGAAGLGVAWPKVSFPWADYSVEPPTAPTRLSETPRGDALRKLLLMFRRQRARRIDTVMKARWGPGQEAVRDELISLAEKHNVIARVDRRYFSFASQFDSLMTVFSRPEVTDKARQFLSAFLGEEVAREVLEDMDGSSEAPGER